MGADDGNLVDRVVEILVGAFYRDPTWTWAFPDDGLRKQQHARLWRLAVEGAVRYPTVWLNAASTSAAVWIPPGGTELSPEQEATLEPLLRELLAGDAGRVLEAFGAFERERPAVPHYYLTLLGTDPEHLGTGSGLQLLRDTLGMADGAGVPAYLEASHPGNVALYERYGFRVRSTFRMPHDGPEVTTMWREPGEPAAHLAARSAARSAAQSAAHSAAQVAG